MCCLHHLRFHDDIKEVTVFTLLIRRNYLWSSCIRFIVVQQSTECCKTHKSYYSLLCFLFKFSTSQVKPDGLQDRTFTLQTAAGFYRTDVPPTYTGGYGRVPTPFWDNKFFRTTVIAQYYTKAVCTSAMQLQYNCNTRIFLCCICTALVQTPAIQHCNTSFLQLAENFQVTCSSCKKLVLQLHCARADCCNTTKFLCYVIVVVLHFYGPLKARKVMPIFLLLVLLQ